MIMNKMKATLNAQTIRLTDTTTQIQKIRGMNIKEKRRTQKLKVVNRHIIQTKQAQITKIYKSYKKLITHTKIRKQYRQNNDNSTICNYNMKSYFHISYLKLKLSYIVMTIFQTIMLIFQLEACRVQEIGKRMTKEHQKQKSIYYTKEIFIFSEDTIYLLTLMGIII